MSILSVCIKLLIFYCLPSYGFFTTTNNSDNNFKIWQNNCNCSCAVKHNLVYAECTTQNIFKVVVTNNDHVILLGTIPIFNLSKVQYENLKCEDQLSDDSELFMVYMKCYENTFFAFSNNTTVVKTPIVAPKTPFKSVTQDRQPTMKSTSDDTPIPEEVEAKRFTIMIIGLCTGLGLVASITIFIICLRRRTKKKKQEKTQQEDYENINEEDDSLPYRIVDLSTNISCDSSGYTFLKGQRECEEKPYQKLKTTHMSSCSEESQSSSAIRQETGVKATEEDEPVYFMLEGKSELNV